MLKISDLIEKNESIEKNSFFLLIKNELKNTYYQQNKEKLKEYARNCYHSSNGKAIAKEYYIDNKEKLQELARNWYRNFSEEGNNNKKREYRRNRYKNMFEEYKQKLKRYGKSYHNVSKVTLQKIIYHH